MPYYLNSPGSVSPLAAADCVSAVEPDTILRPLFRLGRLVKTWDQRHRQRRQLRELPPHLLGDIGISEVEAYREATKPFWIA
ncbi:MAG: DUF1127 domain-containing protein [Gammaproteobacteria bacterium]|nr:DUF1127 domain-containing protein [Gammaproteobacteria bacterium]MYG67407.1 DUF1127 domain-containing protein [Gammaproteobacteria bacterium]